jgi:hypothetical protein
MKKKLLLVAVFPDRKVLVAELQERPDLPADLFIGTFGMRTAEVWLSKPENAWFDYPLVRQYVTDYIIGNSP